MDKQIELSETALKKALFAIAHETAGVTDVKHLSYIKESGQLLLDISVNMKRGTIIPVCAKQLQMQLITRCKELLDVDVKTVNIGVRNLV